MNQHTPPRFLSCDHHLSLNFSPGCLLGCSVCAKSSQIYWVGLLGCCSRLKCFGFSTGLKCSEFFDGLRVGLDFVGPNSLANSRQIHQIIHIGHSTRLTFANIPSQTRPNLALFYLSANQPIPKPQANRSEAKPKPTTRPPNTQPPNHQVIQPPQSQNCFTNPNLTNH